MLKAEGSAVFAVGGKVRPHMEIVLILVIFLVSRLAIERRGES